MTDIVGPTTPRRPGKHDVESASSNGAAELSTHIDLRPASSESADPALDPATALTVEFQDDGPHPDDEAIDEATPTSATSGVSTLVQHDSTKSLAAAFVYVLAPLYFLIALWPAVTRASQDETSRDPLTEAVAALTAVLVEGDEDAVDGQSEAPIESAVGNDVESVLAELAEARATLSRVEDLVDEELSPGDLTSRTEAATVAENFQELSDDLEQATARTEAAVQDLAIADDGVATAEVADAIERLNEQSVADMDTSEIALGFGLSMVISNEALYLVLATAGGMLGGGLRSLIVLTDPRAVSAKLPFHGAAPILGGAVAVVVYFLIRGGLLNVSSAGANLNPFTIVGLSIASGIFFDQIMGSVRRVLPTGMTDTSE